MQVGTDTRTKRSGHKIETTLDRCRAAHKLVQPVNICAGAKKIFTRVRQSLGGDAGFEEAFAYDESITLNSVKNMKHNKQIKVFNTHQMAIFTVTKVKPTKLDFFSSIVLLF